MQVKINDKETYDIEVPNEVDLTELSMVVERLSKVLKVFGKDITLLNEISNENNEHVIHIPRKYTKHKKSSSSNRGKFYFRNSREGALDYLRILYQGTNVQKEAFATKFDSVWRGITNAVNTKKLAARWNITPKEIGIVKFPARGENAKFL